MPAHGSGAPLLQGILARRVQWLDTGRAPLSPPDRGLQRDFGALDPLSHSRCGPSGTGLDRWRRGCRGWFDRLLGLQLWEGLDGWSRSEPVWRLLGVDRDWEGWTGRGWRSRRQPLWGHSGSDGLAGVRGRHQLWGPWSPALGWSTAACLLEQGVGEPHGGLGCHTPPGDMAPDLAAHDDTCQGG